MTRTQLAEQLREWLSKREDCSSAHLARLNKLDDDHIVNSYLNVACEYCGKKPGEGLDAEQVLAESRDLDDFLDRCTTAKDHAHLFTRYNWPIEIDVEGTEGGAAK